MCISQLSSFRTVTRLSQYLPWTSIALFCVIADSNSTRPDYMNSDTRRMVAPWLHPVLHPPPTGKVNASVELAGQSEQKVAILCHIHPMSSHLKIRNFLRQILIGFWKNFHSFICLSLYFFFWSCKRYRNSMAMSFTGELWAMRNTTSQFVFNPLPNNFLCCPHSLLWLLLVHLRRLLSLSFLSYLPLEVSIPTKLRIYSVCEQVPLKRPSLSRKCS